MHWLSLFAGALVLGATNANPAPKSSRHTQISNKILNLRKTGLKADSSRGLQNIQQSLYEDGADERVALLNKLAATATTPLEPASSGGSYAVDVQLGGESFTLIFDTGSSDLWVATSAFKCLNARGAQVPTRRCNFGPLWDGQYEDGQVPRQNFNISYGSGEFLTGTLGYEDVTIAGITLDHQEIAAVQQGYWSGDGVTSGIVGFAYSSLTSAYRGNNPANDNVQTNNIHYDNWITNAIDEGEIDSLFSVAIERGPNGGGGQVALGGLPTINFNHNFASTPIEIYSFTDRHPQEASNYTYYTIQPDGMLLNGQNVAIDFPVIVDTGTTLVYFPKALARAINQAFDPPSVNVGGMWENDCGATPPTVSITIGGKNFKISAAELLLQGELGVDPQTGGCVCGIQASPGPYILGDVFLKNVVAVFDIGESEMRFAPHVNY